MSVQEETQITCPFCWETLTVLLDLSVEHQDYIEDCHVCCQPMRLVYESSDGMLISIEAHQDT